MPKITPSKVKSSFSDLKDFAIKATKNSLYLVQLSAMYVFLDGWDEDMLKEDGFILRKATFPRRCNGNPTTLEHVDEALGLVVRTEPKRLLTISPFIAGQSKYKLSDLHKAIISDETYASFHKSKKLKDQPFIFRQLFMEGTNLKGDGNGDTYIWTRTSIPSKISGRLESRMILTHVNNMTVGEIFSNKKMKVFQDRVLNTVKRISQNRPCKISKATTEEHEQVVCNNIAD